MTSTFHILLKFQSLKLFLFNHNLKYKNPEENDFTNLQKDDRNVASKVVNEINALQV